MKIYEPLSFIYQNRTATGEFRKEIANSVIEQYGNSDNIFHIHALAIAYQWKGAKYRKQAIECYDKFIAMSGGLKSILDWKTISDYGTLLQRERDYVRAIDSYKQLIKIEHGDNCASYIRMLDCCLLIDFNYAITIYESIINTDLFIKYEWTFKNWYAKAYYKVKQYEKALELYYALFEIQPNNIDLVISVSESLLRLHRYRESLDFLDLQKKTEAYTGLYKNVSFTHNLDKQICKVNNIYVKHIC